VTRFSALAILCLLAASGLQGRQKKQEDYGNGFAVQVPAPESEVIGAVQEVVQDGIVQGSVEYNKDKYVEKAGAGLFFLVISSLDRSPARFSTRCARRYWPRQTFKDSGDSGTLAVRYVVLGQGSANTLLRHRRGFCRGFPPHRCIPSNGSVESSEFKTIQDQIEGIELKKKQATEAEKQHQQDLAQQVLVRPPDRGK